MPTAFWLACADSHDSMLQTVIDELFRRGVFDPADVDRGRAEAASGPRRGKGR